MITSQKNIYFEQDDRYIEARGLSTDTKPTTGIANGSIFIEMDTGKVYFFDAANGEWAVFSGSGGGGGGGGDSDFSTAEVTFTNNTGELTSMTVPIAVEANALGEGTPAATFYEVRLDDDTPITVNVVLYKGTAACVSNGYTEGFETTGDIQMQGDGFFVITGDGTITISQI